MSHEMPTKEEEHNAGLHEVYSKFDCRLCELRGERALAESVRAQLADTERQLTASLAAESLVSTRLAAAETLVIEQREVLLAMKTERDEARAACAAMQAGIEKLHGYSRESGARDAGVLMGWIGRVTEPLLAAPNPGSEYVHRDVVRDIWATLSRAGISHGESAAGIVEAFEGVKASHRDVVMRVAERVLEAVFRPNLADWVVTHGNPATMARKIDLAAIVKEVEAAR